MSLKLRVIRWLVVRRVRRAPVPSGYPRAHLHPPSPRDFFRWTGGYYLKVGDDGTNMVWKDAV